MADGYDAFEYLGSRPKKKKKRTVGNTVPVTRINNPYYPTRSSVPKDTGLPPSLVSALGTMRQSQSVGGGIPSTELTTSFESDPILARIRALGQMNVSNARAEAESARRQAVVESGVNAPDLGVDAATLQAAQQNPFSALANLRQEATTRQTDLNEALNKENLFYGGTRINKLGELERNRAQGEVDISNQLRGTLSGIAAALAAAEQQAQMDELEGLLGLPPEPVLPEELLPGLGDPTLRIAPGEQFISPEIAEQAGVLPVIPTMEDLLQYPEYDPYLTDMPELLQLLGMQTAF